MAEESKNIKIEASVKIKSIEAVEVFYHEWIIYPMNILYIPP